MTKHRKLKSDTAALLVFAALLFAVAALAAVTTMRQIERNHATVASAKAGRPSE